MICENCNEPRLVIDFIKNQKFCYKCEYRIKLRKMRKLEEANILRCRMCAKEIVQKKDFKKRQRNIYCSQKCADEGHRKLINNHWTRHIKTERAMSWKINHS